MTRSDPTAAAAIQSNDSDVLGSALAQLDDYAIDFVVLRYAFDVPWSALVRLFKARSAQVLPDYDYLGRMHNIVGWGRRQLGTFLGEKGISAEDLNWLDSAAVRAIGTKYHIHDLVECNHCHRRKIPILGEPTGRPREYCSNPCRQAAYRKRKANPAAIAAALNDPEHGMLPCFAGIERRIPLNRRLNLIALAAEDAISMKQVILEDAHLANPDLEHRLRWRWSPTSPLFRAAKAALAYAEKQGATLTEVFLHGQDIKERTTPYSIGFDCRYLGAMPRVFREFGGTDWIEIPRPSRHAPLRALHIKAKTRPKPTST